MEEKRRGRVSFVGLPVQPMRSMPLERHVILCVKSSLCWLQRAEIRSVSVQPHVALAMSISEILETGVMFKRSARTEKTGSGSWRKPVVEYEKHPVLRRMVKVSTILDGSLGPDSFRSERRFSSRQGNS